MTTRTPRLRSVQGGFSLLEALAALLVTALGMLAVAGLQVSLSQSSDVAKQRSEALRLAQKKMEELRAYEQIDTATGKFAYADIGSGGDQVSGTVADGSYTTNTTYGRTWTVGGTAFDPHKRIKVEVTWTDRTSTQQTVRLQSVIAKANPAGIGTLAVGPGDTQTRSPKNRSVDIPYPALSLGGDKSGFQPPGSAVFYIFDNKTGEVLGYCNTALAENSNVVFDGINCTAFGVKPLLLSGYIRFVSGMYNLSNLVNPNGATLALTAAVDLTVGTTAVCYTQRQKVVSAGNIAAPLNVSSASRSGNTVTVTTVSNHGFRVGDHVSINGVNNASFNGVFVLLSGSGSTFTYAQNGANASFSGGTPASQATLVQEITIPETTTPSITYNMVKSTFVAYSCLVAPVDHDSNPATPNRWSGKLRIAPSGAWTIGTGSSDWKMCRYTGDYFGDGQVSNSENPLYYRAVTGALDNQNFVVIDGNRNCLTDSAASLSTGKYTNVNTTLHQTDVTGGGGLRSGTNSGGAANNGGFTTEEPSDTTVALPMF